MNIHKRFIHLALAGLYLAATINIAGANPVNINITGKVVASPCTVDTTKSQLNVNLGDDIQATALAQPGNVTTFKIFYLILKDCPFGTTSVTAAFSGTPAANSPGDYANTGTATNVNVQLKESLGSGNGKFLGPGTTLKRNVATDRTVSFPIGARAIAAAADVMPGTIVTVSQVTFTYQ
ncbi:fimbrial protein [Citrobacter braakii]|uniref:fimbrial protein n=1 Tax=Citrobacter braakii TaxID=57706 RepID=UPI001F3DDFE8|nr:fimbrial protein [Citrobacter braakii]MCF2475927.1 type 1 fimbrial protein [Citrobacter braakii]WFV23764.1 type 1 fimbrial protein [Citrobacter braakii]